MKHDIPATVTQAPGRSYQDLLDLDTKHEIPEALRYFNVADLGVEPIRASRYTDRGFFLKEVEKVFLKTWQYAVHADEIPNHGDTHVFNLLDKSLLITRQADGSIKAMQNVCLHRGRRLATEDGCKKQFRCPYHGLTWNADGSFKRNPFAWDFPQIDESDFALPEVRIEEWAGFVFVNFDADAPPLTSLMGDMPQHFEHWLIRDCYKAAHVSKVVPANWKAVAEAFLEVHHVMATHPQAMPFIACEQSQYDLVSDHVTRHLSSYGVVGELWSGPEMTEDMMIQNMLSVGSRANKPGMDPRDIKLGEGETARSYMAEIGRSALTDDTGRDFSRAADAEFLDGSSYDIFPNFHLWGGFGPKICYRFRPLGMDHEQTVLDIMLFKIAPKDGPKPAPVAQRFLGEDDLWASATELGYLAGIFDQDQSNLGPIQQGLRDLGQDGVVNFARYEEMRCRNLHRMIDVYLGR